MVYTTMELGRNYSNNKRKIMNELKYKQTNKKVSNYIKERFVENYHGEYKPSDWEKNSNGDLERTLYDLMEFKEESINNLKDELNRIMVSDEIKDEDINFHLDDNSIIKEFIKDESWGLIYDEIYQRIQGFSLHDYDMDELNQIVSNLDDLISLENTILHIMEILTSRVGLEEKITYKSK